ncbi:chromosome segregation SMC family protein [Microvirga sp. 17 mud 1-3]|uniref:chromosome segregation SMC family protein n=1 Tax=Microvirga sp. 17 mud 1-3 TaxID=2082949 RepID=UPI000D6BCBAB|nr:AAA family ATPase [Microvirga sp. 17 mud 1-3]AWM87840.1 chromosome segregation protein SMC [Microvirga sp. 17 mud 1-3]
MKLTRLRIAGFKTFVEPTDFLIEPGLTGVVGPNGCGKSNLVEALRWVMGENSHKNMRATGMDDVIFSGSGGRPARNSAEVMITIDNAERTAPAAFNDAELLEISRKIEREEGSTYRINGKEVRARDVQILFADAATGARSPALVRQGQISEIISAKPQSRRRILEDAAGIAGLHARRHEAELRLKAAEDNLLRVEDVIRELESQVDSLKRQGRQAARYKNLSSEIRRLEALMYAIGFAEAREQAAASEQQAADDLKAVADRTEEQTKAATAQAIAAHAIPPLREEEAKAAAALQRLTHARNELESEERRSKERVTELERHIGDLHRDLAREAAQRSDAEATIGRLTEEEAEIALTTDGADDTRVESEERLHAAEAALNEAEAALSALQAQTSDLNARRAALERAIREEMERAARFAAERERIERDIAALAAPPEDGPSADILREEMALAEEVAENAEEAVIAAREALAAAREGENRLRQPLNEAERKAQRLETEARTLAKLVTSATGDLWPPALDQITVDKGYETALGAALGDDLDASTNPSAPAHWAETGPGESDPVLPEGVTSLADLCRAPAPLRRRLRQIGVVTKEDGLRLRGLLKPGQRLVSQEGDLWRWDGFTTAAEAPSPAARRLAEKNRLGDLEREAAAARKEAERLRHEAEEALGTVRTAASHEMQAIEAARQARQALDAARTRLTQAERREAELGQRRSALQEALARLSDSESEAQERVADAQSALEDLAPAPDLENRLLEERTRVAERRAAASEARAALQSLVHEAEMRRRRREAIAADIRLWTERAARAARALEDLGERLERAQDEHQRLLDAPDTYLLRRRALMAEVEEAEARRKEAADRLADAETHLAETDRAARAALEALSAARESRAGSQARHEAAVQRLAEITRAIAENLDTTPAGLIELAGLKDGIELPSQGEIEAKLHSLKNDRERLGAVNLRAEEELNELETKHGSIATERDDLVEAIKRLRGAIGSLNREGRERLLAAFDVVNAHFQRLFSTLFGGGTAELTLVDSDDPLEAGLEILARPPGKKPQSMTLLSGGEQALTATALIFAVFLTNPSPICVLDEVDAPLDDANVERYCDLLEEMARSTETRFVVITHNPITMARMDRLFGVTMAERGVSQLVSVDLQSAERILETV